MRSAFIVGLALMSCAALGCAEAEDKSHPDDIPATAAERAAYLEAAEKRLDEELKKPKTPSQQAAETAAIKEFVKRTNRARENLTVISEKKGDVWSVLIVASLRVGDHFFVEVTDDGVIKKFDYGL